MSVNLNTGDFFKRLQSLQESNRQMALRVRLLTVHIAGYREQVERLPEGQETLRKALLQMLDNLQDILDGNII